MWFVFLYVFHADYLVSLERKIIIPLIDYFFTLFFQSHNDFVAILDLPEGEHQYKFFVDGQWVHDISEVRSFNMSLCFKTYCFLLFHVHLRGLSVISKPLTWSCGYLPSSQLLRVSWAPSITWSRWRSQTLRYLTHCRLTLWNARTHQVRQAFIM